MTHTEESLMALADAALWQASLQSGNDKDKALRLAIREVLAERDQLAILVKLRPAPEVRDDAVLRERAERAEAEVERLRKLLEQLWLCECYGWSEELGEAISAAIEQEQSK